MAPSHRPFLGAGDGDRLRLRIDRDAQHVIYAVFRTPYRDAVENLNRASGLLTPAEVLSPPPSVWPDQ